MEWKVGIETDFSLSVGKNSKYLSKYVSPQEWKLLLQIYNNSSYHECWDSLYVTIELFKSASLFVARSLEYNYNLEEEWKVSVYLDQVRNLPEDAQSF